jgi:hypothetical protein
MKVNAHTTSSNIIHGEIFRPAVKEAEFCAFMQVTILSFLLSNLASGPDSSGPAFLPF